MQRRCARPSWKRKATAKRGLGLTFCLLFAAGASPARAVLWDGGGTTSEWIEPANWQFNLVPTTADIATIVNDTATISGRTVPTVKAVELGMGSLPGSLMISGGVNPGGLHVVTSVVVAAAGNLTLGGGGPASSQLTANALTTAGTVAVLSRGVVDLTGQLTQTAGMLNLNGGSLSVAAVSVQAGAFNASGNVGGNVTIGDGGGATAILAPKQVVEINGDLKLASDARLEVAFRSGVFDQLEVSGTATLGGVLDLSFLGTAPPAPGSRYPILTASALKGAFTDIVGTNVGGGSWIPDFDITNGINVFYTELPGNMNGDDAVDELDVELFAHAIRDPNTYHVDFFLAGDVADSFMADMDGDGSNTFADIPPFLEAVEFFGGSSDAALAAITQVLSVPEPSSATIVLAAAFISSIFGRSPRSRGRRG